MPTILHLERQDFLQNYWKHKDGEHVVVLGPTGAGKSTLLFQLLGQTTTPQRPGVMLVMKPRDKVVRKFAAENEWKIVRGWPPPRSNRLTPWREDPPGWVFWPPHTFQPERDNWTHSRAFRGVINDVYKRGNQHLVVDETGSLEKELNLKVPVETLLSKLRSMDGSMWGASQRAAYITTMWYSQTTHLFLAYDPNKNARDRFAEIGGVDPDMVKYATARLPMHHWLYIRRSDRVMCVVGP